MNSTKTIKDQLAQLFELQKSDVLISELTAECDLLPIVLNDVEENITKAKEKKESIEIEIKNLKVKISSKEKDIKELDEKILKLTGQMNTASTNKEYQAFQHEIDGVKANISKHEDETLLLYDKIEELENTKKEQQNNVELKEQELNNLKKEIEAKQNEIKNQIENKLKERNALADMVEEELLQKYEKIRNHKKDGFAIVPVSGDNCNGCYIKITPQEINELLKNKEIIVCRNCSRILFLQEDENT